MRPRAQARWDVAGNGYAFAEHERIRDPQSCGRGRSNRIDSPEAVLHHLKTAEGPTGCGRLLVDRRARRVLGAGQLGRTAGSSTAARVPAAVGRHRPRDGRPALGPRDIQHVPRPRASRSLTLSRGTFTLSIDFELIWGTV